MEKECKNNVSCIRLDSCYILSKGVNGAHAKFVPGMGSVLWTWAAHPTGCLVLMTFPTPEVLHLSTQVKN